MHRQVQALEEIVMAQTQALTELKLRLDLLEAEQLPKNKPPLTMLDQHKQVLNQQYQQVMLNSTKNPQMRKH